jgi:L-threonylcarbamoyladenylate synthase
MPNHKMCIDIIRESGLPLAAPSANTSGIPSPTTPYHVEADMDGKISAIVYGDECSVGVESTVVSFCVNPPRLLRPGAVTVEQLREIIPDISVDKAVLAEPEKGAKVESPGMKYKHYAPNTETFLVEGESSEFVKFVNSKEDCVAVCFEEEADGITIPKIVYGNAQNQETLAHEVFGVLRKVDDFSVSRVFIHAPQKTGVGLAVYNRLLRAAAFRVIEL